MNEFDVVVIGAGPGGYPAAIRAAQLGLRTAIVEKECLGGTCLNFGCIPTKTLIASAELYTHALNGAHLGIETKSVKCDYAKMVERKNEVVAKLTGGIGQLLAANKVEVIKGTARFESATRLSVREPDGNIRWISAAKTIIAAGSKSAMPGFIPRHERILESRAFLDLKKLPANLLVLGGGVIGCEFACLAAQLGTKVTICEMMEDILPMVDKDVRRVLRKNMDALGIRVCTGAPLSDIKADSKGVSGNFNGEEIKGDMLLVAIGRAVDTAPLNLAAAGIEPDKRGQIAVDDQCRTSVPNIFAVGDVVSGNMQLAHVATSQGVLAAEVAAGSRRKREKVVPSCIFTSPEIGLVGMTEAAAQAAGRKVVTGTFSFAALGKALAAGTPEGFVKWVVDAETDQLLGAQAVGSHATELIATAATAVRNELTAAEFGNTIQSHPTLSEAWMEAAHAVHGCCIHGVNRRK